MKTIFLILMALVGPSSAIAQVSGPDAAGYPTALDQPSGDAGRADPRRPARERPPRPDREPMAFAAIEGTEPAPAPVTGSPFNPRRGAAAAPAVALPPPAPIAAGVPPMVIPEVAPLMAAPPSPPVQAVKLGGAGNEGRTFVGIVGEKALYRTSEGQYVFEQFEIK